MHVLATLAVEEGLVGRPDWAVLGLVSSIIGAFLIANAILFEHPRRLVARYFGRKTGRLQSVREYVYNRVQTTLGFTFLLGGFALQLVGQYQTRADLARGTLESEPLGMFWVGLLVVVAVGLLFSGWWWSLWAFRRYVKEYFTHHPVDLESEPVTAREIGDLFGIESHDEDTVTEYVARMRRTVGLPRPGEAPREVDFDTEFDLEAPDEEPAADFGPLPRGAATEGL